MYKYDYIDQSLVDQRVNQFRDQVERRLNGTLAEEEFRPLRLQNGLSALYIEKIERYLFVCGSIFAKSKERLQFGKKCPIECYDTAHSNNASD